MPVTVIATFVARAGREEPARAALEALLAPTRAEPGCLNYDLHRLDADPRRFLFHENWTTEELLQRHLGSTHIERLRARIGELFEGPPEITLWTRLG